MADAESFEPLVHLEEVEVDSGEGDEDVVFKERAKLYRFNTQLKEWRERGTGDARLLKHRSNLKTRFILRQEKTLKVVANHLLNPETELKANMGSDRSWTWVAQDFSEGDASIETFAIRFKTPEIAEQFRTEWDKYRKENEAIMSGQPVASQEKEKDSEKQERDETEAEPEKESEKQETATPAEETETKEAATEPNDAKAA